LEFNEGADMAHTILFNAVDAPFTSSCLIPDNGLASLAACLISAGHTARIWDLSTSETLRDMVDPQTRRLLRPLQEKIRQGRIDESTIQEMTRLEQLFDEGFRALYEKAFLELDEYVRARDVRLLGFKLWIGAGFDLSVELATKLAKRHPRVKVFAGGPLAALAPERVLNAAPVFSGVCAGEGEETIVGLAEYCEGKRALDSVPNLMYREGAELKRTTSRLPELHSLPAARYDEEVYPAALGNRMLPILCINESRGCPMHCPFCAHSHLSGGHWRMLNAEQIIQLMDQYLVQTGIRSYRFSGSFTPGKIYREVASHLVQRNHGFSLSGFAHINGIDPADLPLLRQAGVRALFFGVESGSKQLLSGSLGKRTDPKRIERILSASMDADIFTVGSLIFPAPGETAETEAETRDFLVRVFKGRTNGAVPIQIPLPQPGSTWGNQPQSYGFESDQEALLTALCNRRARHFLPINFFEPLPYSLDGKSFRELSARNADLVRFLRQQEILINLGDDTALIALAAGLKPEEYQAIDHDIFVLCDHERVEQLADDIRKRQRVEQRKL
jgi:radical SAM superfamily enzyme YgiQ (UPF0313 family)